MRRKKSISYLMGMIDEVLNEAESRGTKITDADILDFRSSIRQEGYICDIKKMDEVQNLYEQLAELRQNVKEEEKKQEGQEELKAKIQKLFEEADQTNQEFKNIPNSV